MVLSALSNRVNLLNDTDLELPVATENLELDSTQRWAKREKGRKEERCRRKRKTSKEKVVGGGSLLQHRQSQEKPKRKVNKLSFITLVAS